MSTSVKQVATRSTPLGSLLISRAPSRRRPRSDRRIGWHAERRKRTKPRDRLHVIEAADLHAAVVKAKGCPGLSSGGSVKVYQAMEMS